MRVREQCQRYLATTSYAYRSPWALFMAITCMMVLAALLGVV